MMPEQAEFVPEGTGKTDNVPYIRYTPWEPTPGYDVRTLAQKLDEALKRIAHLEAIVHKYINLSEGEL
jgi:hypothetical protein